MLHKNFVIDRTIKGNAGGSKWKKLYVPYIMVCNVILKARLGKYNRNNKVCDSKGVLTYYFS
jgi:hypothetical protein